MSLTHGSAFDLQQYRARLLHTFLALVLRPRPQPGPHPSAAGVWEHPLRRPLVASAFCLQSSCPCPLCPCRSEGRSPRANSVSLSSPSTKGCKWPCPRFCARPGSAKPRARRRTRRSRWCW